jgi:putative membrane protein insertion efficiency factor
MRSRRNRYRDDPYARRGRRGGGGDTCLRDACLLETGCCIGEAIDGSCLTSGLLLTPRLFGVLLRSPRQPGNRPLVGRLVAAIRLYLREISANRAPCCRFTPSCSQYAIEALHGHGARRGLMLAAARLLRCRPGGRRGPDPVPLPPNAAVAC